MSTRTGALISSLRISKQLDFARRLLRQQLVGVFPLFAADRVGFAGAEQSAHDAARRRGSSGCGADATRRDPGRRTAALRLRDSAGRIRRCSLPIAVLASMTLPPPKTLISIRSREQPALISSLISFSMAKLPKRVDCSSSPQPPEWPCAQHEVIHAADADAPDRGCRPRRTNRGRSPGSRPAAA